MCIADIIKVSWKVGGMFMNCRRCGFPLAENQYVCSHCGESVFPTGRYPAVNQGNSCAVVGFIFSLLSIWLGLFLVFNIVALILSIKGRRLAAERGGEGRSLSTAGITISSITGCFWLLVILAMILTFSLV